MMMFVAFCCCCFILTAGAVIAMFCGAFCFLYNFKMSKIQKPSEFERESVLDEILKMG